MTVAKLRALVDLEVPAATWLTSPTKVAVAAGATFDLDSDVERERYRALCLVRLGRAEVVCPRFLRTRIRMRALGLDARNGGRL